MIYGYARVSANDQNLDTQIEGLEKYGVDKIISEKITGIAEDRELDRLIEQLEAGDTLVATRMDRLGRSAKQLIDLVDELEKRSINLVIIDLEVDTKTIQGRFFLQVMAAFAEMERKNNKEKQRRGIELAKKQGKHLGRPREWTKAGLEHAFSLYRQGGKTINEICEITKVSRASFYRHLKMAEQAEQK